MAKKSNDTEGSGSSAPSLSEIASAFFEANSYYDSIVVSDDGIVFENSAAGINAAENHVGSKTPKMNYHTFNRN
jgi:hypothetical protein